LIWHSKFLDFTISQEFIILSNECISFSVLPSRPICQH